jgi:hypothetical protein
MAAMNLLRQINDGYGRSNDCSHSPRFWPSTCTSQITKMIQSMLRLS